MSLQAPSAVERQNVTLHGLDHGPPMLFAHGFGCDQDMWRYVAPAFEATHRVVLFDHFGSGDSDPGGYDPSRHSTLDGYAQDVLAIVDELDLHEMTFVGHSVSAMIGVLAAAAAPERFARLVLIGPSPRYVDDPETGYVGGFSQEAIEGLLDALDRNYLGWAASMAPAIVGNPDRPELGEELTASFCRTDPAIAQRFARVTFLSDNRADLARVVTPSLVMQCSEDVIAPDSVGEYVHSQLRDSTLVRMHATGHCPNLSAPEETVDLIRRWLA